MRADHHVAKFAGGDEVVADAVRQVVDQELIEHILVPRLFELLAQRG